MCSKAEKVALAAGDSVHLNSPGGGGFGKPLERDLALVDRDLNRGMISRNSAETVYGAVVEKTGVVADHTICKVDEAASLVRRSRLC